MCSRAESEPPGEPGGCGRDTTDRGPTDDTTVSVVVPYSPAHTPEGLLQRALDSVRAQSVNTELAVVEDSEQRGPAWARNRGLDRASSAYVAFLDADDIWAEDKLKRQLQTMAATGAGVCVESEPLTRQQFMRELYLGNISSLMSSVVVDTTRVRSRFNEGLERREDHLFVLEAASKAGVCFCQNVFSVGGHEHSLSTDTPTLYRLKQDYQFARQVSDSVPEVERYLAHSYGHLRCRSRLGNTAGDVIRTAFLRPGLRTVLGVGAAILCQQVTGRNG